MLTLHALVLDTLKGAEKPSDRWKFIKFLPLLRNRRSTLYHDLCVCSVCFFLLYCWIGSLFLSCPCSVLFSLLGKSSFLWRGTRPFTRLWLMYVDVVRRIWKIETVQWIKMWGYLFMEWGTIHGWMDGWTDRPTDRRTDGRIGCRVHNFLVKKAFFVQPSKVLRNFLIL